MTTPTAAVVRCCKAYLVHPGTSYIFTPRVDDANTEETANATDDQKFPPLVRIDPGGPLAFAFMGEGRTFSAANSYQQETTGHSAGPVASYAWSGGGSGSSKAYTFGSAGVEVITCTVTDDGGQTAVGRRLVRVVDRAALDDGAVLTLEYDDFAETLPERGWGGASLRVTILHATADHSSTFRVGLPVAIFLEEYEGASVDTLTLTSSGEIFSGFVIDPDLEIDPTGDRFSFRAGTIEQLLGRDAVDSGVQVFIDGNVLAGLDAAFPGPIGSIPAETAILDEKPWHVYDQLTVGKVIFHMLRYHLFVRVNGSNYPVTEWTDFIRDWWNDGSSDTYQVPAFNIPQGNVMRAIAQMAPQGVWACYADRLSGLVVTKWHQAKEVADSVVDSISQDYAYTPIQPINGADSPVSQVKLYSTPTTAPSGTVELIEASYPSSPGATGGPLWQPTTMFFRPDRPEAGTALARGIYDYYRSTNQIQYHLAGATFGLFNIASVTIAGYSAYAWTGKEMYAIRVLHERDHRWMGGHRTRPLFREILTS
jgi:hypothetical protein